jgi:hypothetical protein
MRQTESFNLFTKPSTVTFTVVIHLLHLSQLLLPCPLCYLRTVGDISNTTTNRGVSCIVPAHSRRLLRQSNIFATAQPSPQQEPANVSQYITALQRRRRRSWCLTAKIARHCSPFNCSSIPISCCRIHPPHRSTLLFLPASYHGPTTSPH